jgi:hypothetical protein
VDSSGRRGTRKPVIPACVDAGGLESPSFRRVWTLVDSRGHGLEIYGSEGWGSNSPSSPSHLRAC